MHDLLERLAELEHEQWMAWAKRIMEAEPISEERQQRWQKYMVPYAELPEEVKEQDREWARKVLAVMEKRMRELEEENTRLKTFINQEFGKPLYHLLKYAQALERVSRKVQELNEILEELEGSA